MKQCNIIFYFILLITISFACKKSSSGTKDTTAPVVTFTTPTANGFYASGDTVYVRGSITDDNSLASTSVEIKNKTTSAVLFQQTNSTGSVPVYSFLWKWKNNVGVLTPASVKVVATDASGNQNIATVDISLDH